ncbi:aldo/keto reductase [Streptomyces sp. NPDC020681]|uniref:aldo/keto reductase n=1 Tax=Streptomyces sp. NPDC020681 TaxID=3365083 RepID=UPI00379C51E5
MPLSDMYGSCTVRDGIRVIHRALDLGVTLLDTADMYGPHTNEQLLGRALARRRDRVAIATKFGVVRTAGDTPAHWTIRADLAYVRQACEASLRRLKTDRIDLYYLHRVDPTTPVEETIGALADLVQEGKIRHIGLCETTAETIRRAHRTHPLTAVQSEWSLWSRDIEHAVVPTCRELGIGIVAFAPLGRGFFTGRLTATDRLAASDIRRALPRFSEDNLPRNLPIAQAVLRAAGRLGITAAQLALVWLHHQGDDVVPIPGTRKVHHLEENIRAPGLPVTRDVLASLEEAARHVTGGRYPDTMNRHSR